MAKIAYFDCFSGASGNMLLGALLDAGLDFQDLQADIACLGLSGFTLHAEPKVSHGLRGTFFDVRDQARDHPLRNLAAVRQIIEASQLSEKVRARSLAVFERLARVEARVHGITVEEVHFHEIGAVDTLVDIVGVIAGLERLGVERVYASPLPTGRGHIVTQHGRLPVPAPATLLLLAEVGAPLVPSTIDAELVTPTGAALLAELATFRQPPMRVQAVGHGFGSKELPWANMLRVWLGEPLEESSPHHHHEASEGHAHGGEHGHHVTEG